MKQVRMFDIPPSDPPKEVASLSEVVRLRRLLARRERALHDAIESKQAAWTTDASSRRKAEIEKVVRHQTEMYDRAKRDLTEVLAEARAAIAKGL